MFPEYLTDIVAWLEILPILFFPILLGGVIAYSACGTLTRPRLLSRLTWIAISLGWLGICVGQMTALSREPVVGVVVPSILILIGGFTIYLFSPAGFRSHVYSIVGLSALSVNLLLGASWGAKMRLVYSERHEQFQLERVLARELRMARAGEERRFMVEFDRVTNDRAVALAKKFIAEQEINLGGAKAPNP
jgi:hypothetical protein